MSKGRDPSGRLIFLAAKRRFNQSSGPADDKAGFALPKKAASASYIRAHEWLGYVYDYGYGTRPNRHLAFEHCLIAAKAGNANAEYHVGVFYHEGISVRKNYRAAATWFRRAAKHGDATAVWALGNAYKYGWGLRKNRKRGFELILQAARMGELEAQFSLGVCLSGGEGTAADPEHAFRWYLRAARRGHKDAAHNVAHFYRTGRGVQRNEKKLSFGTGVRNRSTAKLLCGHFFIDDHLQVRAHVLVQLDGDDELADGLERFVQLNLAAINVEALFL